MNKKTLMHIIVPIVLTIISFLISVNFIFKVPNPSGIGYADITYYFGLKIALFTLVTSAIVSAILYVGRKNKK